MDIHKSAFEGQEIFLLTKHIKTVPELNDHLGDLIDAGLIN